MRTATLLRALMLLASLAAILANGDLIGPH
jgi:hypothetical protein